ncbi:MAG TPA: hypothetical protein VM238_05470 [Phycisphaerae bacterium]|nr:hypothetical protein [Phycisphaerae bacterium]
MAKVQFLSEWRRGWAQEGEVRDVADDVAEEWVRVGLVKILPSPRNKQQTRRGVKRLKKVEPPGL